MMPRDAGLAGAGTVRDGLLAGIRTHREEFEAAGERSEELRTLPPDAVETLRDMGVFWLKRGATAVHRHGPPCAGRHH